jgi:hypothetical protein
MKEHSELQSTMEEHCKSLDKILEQINILRQKNASAI